MRKMFLAFLLIAPLATLPAACSEVTPDADPAAELVGLWGAERHFGPRARGELTVRRDGDAWSASIAGIEATVERHRDQIRFELPGEQGGFRGSLRPDGSIRGHFIQAIGTVELYHYALPVHLEEVANGQWRGDVVPKEDRLSFYLVLAKAEDGTVRAFLRNPERNLGRFIRLGRIQLKGDRVEILDPDGDSTVLEGHLNRPNDHLSLHFSYQGLTFDFSRRGRDEAPGFYPRESTGDGYVYRVPTTRADGWETASPASVGMNREPLEELVRGILATRADGIRTPYIHALLVARHGKLVLEEYFHGFHADYAHDTRSAGKSLASFLMGAAIHKGASIDVAAPALDFFPAYDQLEHLDSRKRAVTVEHLLTMSAGFHCDDNDYETPGNEDRMQSQSEQPDWYRYALDLPMSRDPGERGVYCTAGINLLGGVMAHATGEWLPDLFARTVAEPLGMGGYAFNLMPTQQAYMGGGVRLKPRDLLKVGQVVVEGGTWQGERILSEEWVESSTRAQASLNEPDDYGYGWWRKTFEHGGREITAFYASGNGGQLLFAIPELELSVLFMAGNYNDYRTWSQYRDDLLPRLILSSVASE